MCSWGSVGWADDGTKPRRILEAGGVHGGLIVHVGCGDGTTTASLYADDSYLVHGLDTDDQNVRAARNHIQSLGRYGPVSVDTFDGKHLPYADSLVNVIVASGKCQVACDEIARVLAPGGVLIAKEGSLDIKRLPGLTRVPADLEGWSKFIKPWPKEIDEWTHQLHGPGGNPVAKDQIVGPPSRLQWAAGPLWARSHGWTPSVTAMVSAGGRLFYICDETLTCVDRTVPSKWFVVARDAFSGVLLWKHPISKWGSADFSGTPNTGAGVTTGRFTMPPNAGKRLVAVGDTVYVTLGPNAPVTALNAATGEVKQVYADTARADEILCTEGRLIISINPPVRGRVPLVPNGETPPPAPGKRICAVDIETGRMLWNRGPFSAIRACKGQDPFGRLELAAGDGKVFALTTEAIACFDAETGDVVWRTERPALPDDAVRRIGFAGMFEYRLEVMVYHDGVVLLAQPEPNTHHTYHTMPGTLYAFDANEGRQMWKHPYGGWGHCTPPDVFVVGQQVWTHVDAETEFGSVWGNGYRAKDSSKVDYRIQAHDLQTGELQKELPTKEIFNVGHHHRCHRNRITERFLLSCRRGVEFVDLSNGVNYQNHWVRSGCLLGYLPSNGLLYVTPHPCGCYINAKLTGFNALAPKRSMPSERKLAASSSDIAQLTRGPAYGLQPPVSSRQHSPDWPTYRHDSLRSGATEAEVDADLQIAWQSDIGTRPSGLVVAGGRVLVADVESHTVHALSVTDGKKAWEYTAGARVDSPPTFHNGLAIFGSADGRVRCLRAADGALAWQFDAAPSRRLMSAFGQLESPWPVPGSVLVHDKKCWFAAGRSSFLDGGIHVYALDPASGKVHHSETIYSPDPKTGKAAVPETSAQAMEGLLNDIPGTDGLNIFIRQMQVSGKDARGGPHLFTTGGYLDPSWFNRTFWQVGRVKTSGLMVLGKDVAYGVEVYESRSRETVFKPGANVYRLQCISLKPPARSATGKQAKPKRRQQGPKPVWEQHVGIRVTAMIRAGDTIFVAGSPDVVDPEDPHGAWEGRKGGILAAYTADDGKKLAEYALPSPPVWDGMAAAGGRLFISTIDGCIMCME